MGSPSWSARLSVGVLDFPPTAVAGALGATIGAVARDLALAAAGRATQIRGRHRRSAAGVAVLAWSGQPAGLAVSDAVRWPTSLWFGVVVLSARAASALALLATSTE